MNQKIRILDPHGTALEVTREQGDFLRFVTNADHIPQPQAVWLTPDQTVELILQLTQMWSQVRGMTEEQSPSVTNEPPEVV